MTGTVKLDTDTYEIVTRRAEERGVSRGQVVAEAIEGEATPGEVVVEVDDDLLSMLAHVGLLDRGQEDDADAVEAAVSALLRRMALPREGIRAELVDLAKRLAQAEGFEREHQRRLARDRAERAGTPTVRQQDRAEVDEDPEKIRRLGLDLVDPATGQPRSPDAA